MMKLLRFIIFALFLVVGGIANAAVFINGVQQGGAGNVTVHTGTSNPDANYDIGDGVSVGDQYVNTTSDAVFSCSDNSAGAANWVELSASAAGATTEEIQDGAWGSIGTETLINVTYQDTTNDVDFVVDGDLANYTWTNVDDADIPDTITVGASGSVNIAALPTVSGSSAGVAPTTSGKNDGDVLTVQADGTIDYEASAAGVTTFTALTDTPANFTGSGGYAVMVNSTPDALEFVNIFGTAQTITGNWVNTANPWADNEVVDALTVDGGTIDNSIIGGSTPAAGSFTTISASSTATLTNGANITLAETQLIDLSAITMSASTDEGFALPTYADVTPTTAKHYLAYDATNNVLMVYESGGWVDTSAASGASAGNDYLVTQAEGGLTDESVFTDGYAIDSSDAGGDGGAFTVAFDPTEVSADGSDTWSDGSQASIVWTFDVSGTDHTMTAGNGLMTFGDAVTVTDTLTASGNITDGTATWNSTTQALTGFASITSTAFVSGGTTISTAELGVLDTYAGIDPSANVQAILGAADYAAMRGLLDLEAGTDFNAYDADLDTYAGITPSANVQSILGAADYAAIATLQESSLEAVLDLSDLQGSVAATQLPASGTWDASGLTLTLPVLTSLYYEGSTADAYEIGWAGDFTADRTHTWGDYNSQAVLDAGVDSSGKIIAGGLAAGAVGADAIAATAVSAGSYTNADITVDADGRITAASNGSSAGDNVSVDGGSTTDPDFTDGGDINFTNSSNTITATLNNDVVAAAEMADADHGDISWSGGIASLDDDVVAADEMADADHGDVAWSSGVATVQAVSGANAVDSDAYVDGSIDYAHIADSSVGVVTASKSAAYTVGTDDGKEAYGGVIYVTSAATVTLPAVSARMAVTVITIGATAVSVDTNASDRMYLDGTALDDGDKATNTSTTGDMLVCTYESAAGWYCASGSPDGDHWTDGGP